MTETNVDKDLLLDIYRRAWLIHQADAKFRAMITTGQLQILYYSPRGQEVVAAAMMAALRPDDYLVTIYRGIHDQLAKGIPLKELWAEFAGKATGTCKGKGGPMHITHPETGVMVTTGIVGSGMPIANGLGLASQLNGDGRVTVCCFGDGASNIGAFHEALNMASVWKLPVIFLCQNNLYGEHTPYAMSTGAERIADRSISYGMKGVRVNGNDAAAMHAVAREAVARARAGEGPTLIEAMTFRFNGHLLGDDSHYIPKAEMEAAKAADPVPALRRTLLETQVSEATLAALEAEITAQVAEAAQFALDSPYPDLRENRIDVLDVEMLDNREIAA
ncbi:thiamine pyrophosphate-dependent dehydrogenase E1 component subunit alpha [Sandaracinobacter sp. RS1-74]|uniref:thiamine pyrophosphate-dependent dehydrogenase E1 component subunit alpha n=1 Tax=Sandaracinobacteroides sayramensis TaxID=2913411 RepID=UPI001EDAFF5B|nr:thiamine pyrophosphate-dependent dehydrogenase E1 component subunit alpha [Sandaracinobacteroides sayramensis]MCG2840553.1 thiamine pyrophosphate-dependent dehydrogenase E1 component subunit alpha [Sandaracinobacteroides sayramensis]